MNISTKTTGYLFAVAATIACSSTFIFSKAALNQVEFQLFGMVWYCAAFLMNFSYFHFQRKRETVSSQPIQKIWKILLIIGIAETLSATLQYLSIAKVDNPALVSFVSNLGPVFVTLMGIIFLKEKFTFLEIVGLILAFTGIFTVSYNNSFALDSFLISGIEFIILSSVFNATRTILVKMNVNKISPNIFTINRTSFLLVFFIIYAFTSEHNWKMPFTTMLLIIIGAIIGPFLGTLCMYHALKRIEASRVSILLSLQSIIVLIVTFFVFDKLPLMHQIIGGIVAIAGVILVSIKRETRPATPTGGLP